MKLNSIVYKSEIDFRNFVLHNINNIDKLYVFEDVLDKIIFFYCITKNNYYVSSKVESSSFNIYKRIYEEINNKLGLKKEYNEKTLKLKRLN